MKRLGLSCEMIADHINETYIFPVPGAFFLLTEITVNGTVVLTEYAFPDKAHGEDWFTVDDILGLVSIRSIATAHPAKEKPLRTIEFNGKYFCIEFESGDIYTDRVLDHELDVWGYTLPTHKPNFGIDHVNFLRELDSEDDYCKPTEFLEKLHVSV